MRGHLAALCCLLAAALVEAEVPNQGHKRQPGHLGRPSLVLGARRADPPPPSWFWGNVSGVNYLTQVC